MQHVLSCSPLFDGDDTTKPDKYLLTKELEKYLAEKMPFENRQDYHTTLVVDFMSLLRRLPLGKMKVLNDLTKAAWRYINEVCKFQRADIVFDSYTENALKEGECKRRLQVESVEYVSITPDTKSPVHLDRFWASLKNKELLQAL